MCRSLRERIYLPFGNGICIAAKNVHYFLVDVMRILNNLLRLLFHLLNKLEMKCGLAFGRAKKWVSLVQSASCLSAYGGRWGVLHVRDLAFLLVRSRNTSVIELLGLRQLMSRVEQN